MAKNNFFVPSYSGYSYGSEDSGSSNPFGLSADSGSSSPRVKQSSFSNGIFIPSYSEFSGSNKQQEDQKKKKQLDELAKQEQQKQQSQGQQKGFWQQAGDVLGGVGNFVKGAVTDVYNKGAEAVGGIGDVLGGQQAANSLNQKTQQRNQINKQYSDYLSTLKQSDFNNPDVQAKLKTFQDQLKGVNETQQEKQAIQKSQKVDTTKTAAAAAETALNIGTLSVGTIPKIIAEQGTKLALKQALKIGGEKTLADIAKARIANAGEAAVQQGARTLTQKGEQFAGNVLKDMAIGGGYGAAETAYNKDWQHAPGNIATGVLLGGAFEPAVKVLGAVKGKLSGGSKQIINQATQETAQDAAIRKAAGAPEDLTKIPHESYTPLDQLKTDTGANPMVGTGVEVKAQPGKTPTTEIGQSRYVSKTLPESEFVAPDTKKMLGNEYTKLSNADLANNSLKQLDIEGTDNFSTKIYGRLDGQHITPQTVVDAQAAAQALEKRGGEADLQKAADIYNKLADHLTKSGQTVQAASILARQTPEGLSYYIQQQFRKNGVDFTTSMQKDLKSYMDEIRAAKTPEEEAVARDNATHWAATNIPSSKGDKLINFWKANLLTTPKTLLGAVAGNSAQALQRNLITDPIATLADIVTSAFTKERTHAAAGFGSSAKGTLEGLKTITGKQYLKTGYNPLEQGGGKYNLPRVTNYGKGVTGKVVGGYVNGVYKAMGAADAPFRAAAYQKSLSSMARSEAMNQGLKGAEKKSFIQDFIKNPPTDFKNKALKESEEAVFGNDTALGSAAAKLANTKGPVGALMKITIPFTKVPAAVATKVITSTPLGIANDIVRQIVTVKKGGHFDQRQFVKAIGEGMTGVPIIAAGVTLGNAGLITGGYPSSQAERDQWQAEGKKPNSIKIGDKWYSLNYIQPFASLLATGSKFADAMKSGLDPQTAVAQAAGGTVQSVASQSFLSGLQNAINAAMNPEQFANQEFSSLGSSVVPGVIRNIASATDPNARTSNDFVSGIVSGIPGLRESLPAKLDANGEPIKNQSVSALQQVVNPFQPTKAVDTQDTRFLDQAVVPAKKLSSVRTKEINQLLNNGQVKAAQRKIDEYNQQLTQILTPYVTENKDNITKDQIKQIDNLYMGQVWINKKGRPYISSRNDIGTLQNQ